MGRRRKEPEGVPEENKTEKIDVSMIKPSDPENMARVLYRVQADGFVPRDDLYAEFGDEIATRGIAFLYRQWRMFVEVERPWKGGTAKGYAPSDRRFSQAEMKKIPPEFGFLKEAAAKPARYTGFQEIHVQCRWTNKVLGGKPSSDTAGDINVFESMRANGKQIILIPAYCVRAMAKKALPMIEKSMNVAYQIRFAPIRIPVETLEGKRFVLSDQNPIFPILEERHGNVNDRGEGLGIKRSEGFGPDVEFTLSAVVPTSELPIVDYIRMLDMGGKYVRLSPARSSGYGDFEVVEVLNQ